MTDTLFPGFDEFIEEKAGEAQQAYEQRLLKVLYAACKDNSYPGDKREAGEEFGFEWYNQNHELPICLYTAKDAAVAPIELLRSRGMTKTKMWRAYFDVKANHDRYTHVGLVFPVNGLGHWIVHNWSTLGAPSGSPFVTRPARDPDKKLIIMPYKSFCMAVAEWSGVT